ncbi:winged helix-turn-helix transcriptional regulator [Candidatus Kaiserbacteria bacterium]|nr:winged helix-turn-helix transcriptional regulator [Candidatus Kaiserbacteria bacterium]
MGEEKKTKGPRKLERHFKGVANHRRIQILLLVAAKPGISLGEVVEAVRGNMKTISEHVRRLVIAGLVEKRHAGTTIEHSLTPYGRTFVGFIREFSNS